MRIRDGRPEDAALLTAIALRSKAHWGYDAAFLEACRAELTVDPDAVSPRRILVALEGDRVVGFVAVDGEPPVGEIGLLFVEPNRIGRGAGRALFEAAIERARAGGFAALTIDSDPGAEGFYLHMGAVRVGVAPSASIAGRLLPRLRYVT